MVDRPLYTNRLVHEKSPYLLQHAHNPVDWYPWGEEAFQAAEQQGKPIFLSIGYATCHWCHVMERESFEDEEIAQLMNQFFISIKVDREERPDVDSLYMEFAQGMMAGAAGWPLNVFLTPDLSPFFAVTYLPSYSSHGLMGLKDLLLRIIQLWSSEERFKLIHQAEKIVEVFAEASQVKGEDMPKVSQIDEAADLLYKMADPVFGGMQGAPKFPIGYHSSFMLRYYVKHQDNRAIFLVERTLDMMHRGGIYDHLGGGFSRYSVDEQWLVPHFEKMLYDNAILAQSYLEAWQLTRAPLYRSVCEEILQYVLRDMTHLEGGFYSAEDADSEGHEGLFYTWPYQEVINTLGNEEGKLFCEYYNITPTGNFEGRNTLNTPLNLEEFAAKYTRDPVELQQQFAQQCHQLWLKREKRVHPLKDDKILTAWNGLMIYSLAEAGCAFGQPNYLMAAVKAARFIRRFMWQEGVLLRRWREGQAMFKASLDEYAFLIRGLLSLFEANCGTEWLEWAVDMARILQEDYKEEEGAFYQTDGKDPHLILRRCQFSDGAEPSGNAIHGENLLRLYQITGNKEYLSQAEDIFKAVKNYLDNYPAGYIYHLMNLNCYYDMRVPTLVIALNTKQEWLEELRTAIYERFIPHKAVIWHQQDIALEELIPFIKNLEAREDQTTLYICYHGVCQQPLTDLNAMREAIAKL